VRARLFELLRCPACRARLTSTSFLDSPENGEVVDGLLTCACGQRFPIVDTIPRMLPDAFDGFPEFSARYRDRLGLDEPSTPTRSRGYFERMQARTQKSFGYQWSEFSEMVCDFRDNFWNYLYPATPDTFRGQLGLDAGCGFGRHIYHAAICGAEMVGLDFSRAIDSTRGNTRHLPNVHLVQGDIYHPPLAPGAFDFVYSIGVLHHLPDPQKGLQSLTPLLRPGGRAFIWVYSKSRSITNAALELVRHLTTRMPHAVVNALSFAGAVADQYGFVLPYRVLRRIPGIGKVVDRAMLPRIKMYSAYPFRVLHADWFDRLAAPIRFYYSESDVERFARNAGISDVQVTPTGLYGWRACGIRPLGADAGVLSKGDIVCISSIDWDFIWQGHQQIMSMLAAQGNRVLFIENTGVRSPRLDDLGRVRHRIYRWWTSKGGVRQEAPNLHVLSPLILPWPYSWIAQWINRIVLVPAVRRWMRRMDFRRPIVWTFLPTPLARTLLRELEPAVSVYYCVDDLGASSLEARRIQGTEEKVLAEADLVFVTSEKLRARAARFARRVHLFPFGVDYPPFEAARTNGQSAPENIAGLTRPVVGYVGGIHQWIDQSVLAATAQRLQEVTFALVGPLQTNVRQLTRCPNVRLLGACSHADVPRYLKAFDVALIPYRLAEYTAGLYPTKLNEYLAMGLPVVATDLPEIRRFNEEHGNIVTVGRSIDEFIGGVRRALEPSHADEVVRRIEVARRNSWDVRVAEMSRLIAACLERRSDVEGS
jgi:SAM-dependent methyltransferase/uncharacterized protein YbaR (Trm112 family)